MAGALMWIALSYMAGALATYGVLCGALAKSLRPPLQTHPADLMPMSGEVGAAARRRAAPETDRG